MPRPLSERTRATLRARNSVVTELDRILGKDMDKWGMQIMNAVAEVLSSNNPRLLNSVALLLAQSETRREGR